jgi:hypothetical protein
MVEAVPVKPYSQLLSKISPNESLNALTSLIQRRLKMNEKLTMLNISLITIPSFPNLGAEKFYDSSDPELMNLENEKDLSKFNPASNSEFVLDSLANPHNRFPTLMRNIRER